VLQHLVRVHDVEGTVPEVQRVHVTHHEVHIGQRALGDGAARQLQRLGRAVQRGDPTRRHPRGEVRGDGARAAADVEQARAAVQVRLQVGRGVVEGTPAVRAQHALVLAVRVDRHAR
jgi:hypothetical protein